MSVKLFTNLRRKMNENPKLRFWADVAFFLVLMVLIYLYLMFANLSTAPKFIYSQF